MRNEVHIVWLEDSPNGVYEKNREHVKKLVSEKGYSPVIIEVSTLEEAQDCLNDTSKRIDFFISDYNLGEEDNGLDYLISVRRAEKYNQFFILYSNNVYETILDNVIEKLKSESIDLFCNFTFISLEERHSIKENFERAVNISLSRWDELNAIRGLYMCEHAEIEYALRTKLNDFNENTSYKNLFNALKREKSTPAYRNSNKDLYDSWKNLIDMRNSLAHVQEEFHPTDGFYIQSSTQAEIKIYESELDAKRNELITSKEKILKLINNPNQIVT